MTNWVAVTDRLPEHGATVLVWCEGVEIATFRLRDQQWDRESREGAAERWTADEAALIAETGVDATPHAWTDDELDGMYPNEPHFSWSGGDCETTWLASLGFACVERSYGCQPPITHWMPLPDAPLALQVTPTP